MGSVERRDVEVGYKGIGELANLNTCIVCERDTSPVEFD